MLSAHFNQENLETSIGVGARYFQPKPFHSDVLLYSISREFNGKLGEALKYEHSAMGEEKI